MYTSYNKLKSSCDIIPLRKKQHKALHKTAYILQVVVIIIIKRDGIVWNYHILYVGLYITVYIVLHNIM